MMAHSMGAGGVAEKCPDAQIAGRESNTGSSLGFGNLGVHFQTYTSSNKDLPPNPPKQFTNWGRACVGCSHLNQHRRAPQISRNKIWNVTFPKWKCVFVSLSFFPPQKAEFGAKLKFKISIGQRNPGASVKAGVLASVCQQNNSVSL